MPAERRRHVITETPPVKAALDELREQFGDARIEFEELVILGAHQKVAQLRAARVDSAARRHALAERLRRREVPVDRAAADEVRRAGWARPWPRLSCSTTPRGRAGRPSARRPQVTERSDALEAGHVATCMALLLKVASDLSAQDHDHCSANCLPSAWLHYDLIAEKTGLDFDSVWLAAPGTI